MSQCSARALESPQEGHQWRCGYGGETAKVVLFAFDLLMFGGKDVRPWPLEERRGSLFERGRMRKSTASLPQERTTRNS
jgi:ATP-dependent DNA ligase